MNDVINLTPSWFEVPLPQKLLSKLPRRQLQFEACTHRLGVLSLSRFSYKNKDETKEGRVYSTHR
jgi:hypothetical protein